MQVGERVVILASADTALRQRLCTSLEGMRWQVNQATGGAAAMAQLEECQPEALLLDGWLPDLEAGALADVVHQLYPHIDLLRLDGTAIADGAKSVRRHELLHAIREAGSAASWDAAIVSPAAVRSPLSATDESAEKSRFGSEQAQDEQMSEAQTIVCHLPRLVGASAPMLELARLVRLVAPHQARVLIEGETGAGKELVAQAVHGLSGRVTKPFVALNCAAIPEALLEAELFGHTRGAFTGAVQARVGRIEAADAGTLFLDEIGELPLALQAKLLRFLENGELQRIGGNETVRVNVRVISATHQFLEERAQAGSFRLDLYHRLAAFPVQVPALRDRLEDLPMLANYLLAELGLGSPKKRLTSGALERLAQHDWPGNVRELQNVLQRALILSDTQPAITSQDILFGRLRRN